MFSNSQLAKAIQNQLNSCGFELRRLTPNTSPSLQLLCAARYFEIDSVFDVGANIGQFAESLRRSGFKGRITSFEPQTSAHRKLESAALHDPEWTVHPRCAIGDHDGELRLNLSSNSVSSSLLPMLGAHASAAPESQYIGSEVTPVHRFDSIAFDLVSGARKPFLKIDTQGFEWQVLDGASKSLPLFAGVMCELSLVPLYEGQRLWTDVIERLQSAGFSLWALQPGFIDPENGRSLQLDGIFFRT